MLDRPKKILVIQTAFIGDVILATALLEKLNSKLPYTQIDMLVRKGNETLLSNHPFLNSVLIWDKTDKKYYGLYQILKHIRNERYDVIVNTQRFGSTGLLTILSKANIKTGFSKNPFSFGFTHSVSHTIGNSTHEIERNQLLIEPFTDAVPAKPKLYPSQNDVEFVAEYTLMPFITISPSSVWFTKQFPDYKWVEFIDKLPRRLNIFLLGGGIDFNYNEQIIAKCQFNTPENLAGKLSLLQSAALMSKAKMNFVNDSAPLHLCSAVNAPVTSVFCSTIPEFGFTPLSDIHFVVESSVYLPCRPCGLHGKSICPENHFNCAKTIDIEQLLGALNNTY